MLAALCIALVLADMFLSNGLNVVTTVVLCAVPIKKSNSTLPVYASLIVLLSVKFNTARRRNIVRNYFDSPFFSITQLVAHFLADLCKKS